MDIDSVLDFGLKLGADFAEIRHVKSRDTSITFVDGNLRYFASNEDEGYSVRVYIKGAWGFASTSVGSYEQLKEAMNRAFKIAKSSSHLIKESYNLKDLKAYKAKVKTYIRKDFEEVSIEEKLNLVKSLDQSIRNYDSKIKSETVRYNENRDIVEIYNSIGTFVEKEEIYISANALAISFESGKRGRGYSAIGGTGGFEILEDFGVSELGIKSARKAIEQLSAKSVKAGTYTCIMDPILVGVFAHEGIGHPSEADGVVEKNSVLEGRLGEKIANDVVSIVDNPLLERCYGSYVYDDEGVAAKPRYIIKNGVLNEYLHNIETSSILGFSNNGAARADSYLNPPLVRMSNIYFEKGDASFDELIEDIELGIYAKGFEYGYVLPNNGQFTFKCESGYLIEKGEVTVPLRDLSLSGVILETLKNIDLVGKDLEIKSIGNCGKDGQWVRVGDGGPHLRVKGIVVGGVE
ncbi:MAG TPA: TldD/PmbA family protein [Geobacterales bacterium]|nr:TldD/PmbA family protein [Geobacterales bacterium]